MEKAGQVKQMAIPRFTFLLPAYKTRYLEEALQSILCQTYRDFCVIVSDDASPEPIEEVVGRFDDARICYRRNPKNLGGGRLVDHWNLLLDLCESEFVIVASDDDLYAPAFLERVNGLINTCPDADLFRVGAEMIDGEGKILRKESGKDSVLSTEAFIHHMLNPQSILCVGNYVMRATCLREMGGFVSLPLAWKADSATLLALSHNGVAACEEPLFSFRMSGVNISSLSGRQASIDRQKIAATLSFYSWMTRHLDAELLSRLGPRVKLRLEGEMRTYYGSLSLREFFRLYRQMLREKWFYTRKKKLSFLYGWFRKRFV